MQDSFTFYTKFQGPKANNVEHTIDRVCYL